MPNKFDDLMKSTAINLASKALQADDWFQDSVKNINKKPDPNKLFKTYSMPKIGSMFMFVYDPKLKTKLPVYDMYPLVFPVQMYVNGFLGINLHYLPPLARIALLRSLDDIKNNNKYNETTKLNISYRVLKGFSTRFVGVENCIKRYLFSHVRSTFNYVNPTDWEKVALLPLQRWVGKAPY
jgi:hypothetical protein